MGTGQIVGDHWFESSGLISYKYKIKMNIKKTLKRLESKEDCYELRTAARDLGHTFPKTLRPQNLDEFRAELAAIRAKKDQSEFVQGYLEALADVTAAFCASLKDIIIKLDMADLK